MRLPLYFMLATLLMACQPSGLEYPLVEAETSEISILKPGEIISATGKLQYQDRLYTNTGFVASNMPYKPIRNVPVALMAAGQVVAKAISNEQGEFDFSNISEGEYTLRVFAQMDHASGIPITIFDDSGRQYIIEKTVRVTEENNHIEFDALFSDRISGIFNMIDVFASTLDFVSSLDINNFKVKDVNVYWQWGVTRSTYTCRATSYQCNHGRGIYVLSDPNGSGDSDEFDDDVLMHEFAHHLELSMGMTDSPGGMHSLSNYMLDLRLSWSEGMASAFAVSAKKWLREHAPNRLSIPNAIGRDFSNYYIDTAGSRTLISVDMLAASSPYFRYSSNETAVASALLRVQNQIGIEATWKNLMNGLSANSTADTFEAFWDAMVGYEQPSTGTLANWQSAIATKNIYYQADEYETNDSENSAQPLLLDQAQNHFLYRTPQGTDEDWFKINLTAAQQVIIETKNLINGADTLMGIYTLNGQERILLAQNDDAFACENSASKCTPLHNGRNFSSKITFTAPNTGVYYVRIKTSDSVYTNPVNYGYIGRYGGYTVLMSTVSQ